MVTKDYRVPLPVASSKFSSRLGGATGTREGETSISLETEQQSNPWAELKTRLSPLTRPPAQLTILPASGWVSVFGPPSVQRSARKIMEDLETVYGQRVGLEVGVYLLDSDAAESFGPSTSGFRIGQNLARGSNTVVFGGTSPGSISLSDPASGSSLNFEALARDRAVVDYRLASTIAQSGAVATTAIARQQTYVERDEGGTSTRSPPAKWNSAFRCTHCPGSLKAIVFSCF